MNKSLIGRLLGNCYIESFVGDGATSEVYKAQHQTLGIPVALKILRPPAQGLENSSTLSFAERFRREAHLAARLSHPGIVRILDFGETNGTLYQVLEYVEGDTLLQYLRKRGKLSESMALRVIAYLAGALEAAHKEGIIHRDLKPSNVLIDKKGHLKISDLGLAKDSVHVHLTSPDNVVGTPTYMAPELFQSSHRATVASDIYALGIMLYQCLVGRPPFLGDYHQVVNGHINLQPMLPPGHMLSLSPATWEIVRKMLHKIPGQRHASCSLLQMEIRERLEQLKGNASVVAAPASQASGTGESNTHSRLNSFLEKRFGSKQSHYQGIHVTHTTFRERVLVWALLAGLAIVGVLGYFLI